MNIDKYKHLVFNGCSFIAGGSTFIKGTDEGNNSLSTEERLELSVSRLLSKKMNCIEHNLAEPAGSNQRIVRTTFDFINENKELKNKTLIIVGLTQIARMEILFEGEPRKVRMGQYYKSPLHWMHPSKHTLGVRGIGKKEKNELERWLKTHITYFYDEDWEIKELNRNLVMLQTFVKSMGFDIIYFSSILELDYHWKGRTDCMWSNYNLKLEDMDKLKLVKFPNNKLTWRDWMNRDGHPNDEDHKNLCNLLYDYIRVL